VLAVFLGGGIILGILLVMAIRLGIRMAAAEVRGIAVDVAVELAAVPIVWFFHLFSSDDLHKLHFVGHFGPSPQINWSFNQSLVVITDAVAQEAQHYLGECLTSTTHNLQITTDVSIECSTFESQLDRPIWTTALRRESTVLQHDINNELASELSDFVRFLHLLRRNPSAAALDPQAPPALTTSRWQSIWHDLDVTYRTVWCRWIRKKPRSTLESRVEQLKSMFGSGANRRGRWHQKFLELHDNLKHKHGKSCPDCATLETEARRLGPASLSSSPFEVLRIHYISGLSLQRPRPRDKDSAPDNVKSGSTTSGTEALVKTHAASFGLQTIAGRCVARCAMLDEHLKGLAAVLAWLDAEKEWWGKLSLRHPASLLVDSVDTTVVADLYRFEEVLDRIARTALARGGLE
jgi:hypothetical protein